MAPKVARRPHEPGKKDVLEHSLEAIARTVKSFTCNRGDFCPVKTSTA